MNQTLPLDLREGWVKIHNDYDFLPLSHLRSEWEISVDGEVWQRACLPHLTTPPRLLPGQEAFLTIRFRLAKDCAWADTGRGAA